MRLPVAGEELNHRLAVVTDAVLASSAVVRRIPRGKVATYGQLSLMIDGRLTPIGVGWAIRAAPEGSIPWQRVVNAKGGISLDPTSSGLTQRLLLEQEGVLFDPRGRIPLTRYQWRPRS